MIEIKILMNFDIKKPKMRIFVCETLNNLLPG